MPLNKISAKGVHVLLNKIIAILYAILAFWATWAAISSGAAVIMIYVLPALALAAGHFKYKRWALMTSSIIFGVVSGLGVFYMGTPFSTDEEMPLSELPMRIKHYSLFAMLALLMMLNYVFYGKLTKTGSMAVGEKQPAVADKIEAKGWLLSANRVIAFAYVALSSFVMWILVKHDGNRVANMLLTLLGLTMAAGHFKYQEWALRVSAVIGGFIGLMTLVDISVILHMTDSFKPKMALEIVRFAFTATVAILMMLNYIFYRKQVKRNYPPR